MNNGKDFEHVTNETLRTIYKRHSIRQFTEQDISQSDIMTILHAANQAPSAHNQQSWRFIVIKGSKKNDLVNLIADHAPKLPRPSSAILRMAARSINQAPVVIAVVNTGELTRRGPELFEQRDDTILDFFRVMEIQSSAAAVENMLLAATSLGIASVWLGILIVIQKYVLEFLGTPDGEFMAVIPIGYALKQNSGPQKRPLDVVFLDY